jgi:hypothetical protein
LSEDTGVEFHNIKIDNTNKCIAIKTHLLWESFPVYDLLWSLIADLTHLGDERPTS